MSAARSPIAALFALSLDLVLGYAGIVTLGHAMFFGLGAYAAGLWRARLGRAAHRPCRRRRFAGAARAIVTSFLVVRVRHLARLMVTLGLGLLLLRAANARAGSPAGRTGCRASRSWPVFGPFRFDLRGRTAYAYALVVLFLGCSCRAADRHSPFGLALRGIRENVARMPAIGAPSRAHLRGLHDLGGHGRRRRRAAHADDASSSRSTRWASSARPTCWSC